MPKTITGPAIEKSFAHIPSTIPSACVQVGPINFLKNLVFSLIWCYTNYAKPTEYRRKFILYRDNIPFYNHKLNLIKMQILILWVYKHLLSAELVWRLSEFAFFVRLLR